MRLLFFLFLYFSFIILNAQLKLGKSIGLDRLPADQDTLQRTLKVVHDGTEPGPKAGTMINYFKLYGINNDSLDIAIELQKGKYVMLINGSYTCPFFRRSLHFFDSIAAKNKNVSLFIIYTIEGHPDYPFVCPYTNEVTVLKINQDEDILIKQPRTYGERKEAACKMFTRSGTKLPVMIDGPGNEWLNNFGIAPATAFIISPEGKLRFKYLDYKRQKKEICRDLNLIKN